MLTGKTYSDRNGCMSLKNALTMDLIKMIFSGFASYELSFSVFFLELNFFVLFFVFVFLFLIGWEEEICRNSINKRQCGQLVKALS